MAVVGKFGKLLDSVITRKGDPLSAGGPIRWGPVAVAPSVMTNVFSWTVTAGKPAYINLVTAVSRNYLQLELRRNALVVFPDRSSPGSISIFRTFPEGAEIIGQPGDVFEVYVRHFDTIILDVEGIVGGFRQ